VSLDVSVVVPSHDRAARLRALLDALEAQELARDRFEAIVVHDSTDGETEDLLRSHPLAAAGILRHVTLPPDSALPAAKRNVGWRAARARLVAFTDDDCRPPPTWLGAALTAARRQPGAIVQGATFPDPEERLDLRARFAETQHLVPPTIWAETCNILYPRDVLERVGGLDDSLLAFEDTDLALRAQEQGVPFVGAPEVITYHAVHTSSLARKLRGVGRWRDGPATVKRHPGLRESLPLGIFWKPTHAWLPLAVLGLALEARRHRGAILLGLPWAVQHLPRYGRSPRGRLRSVVELPAQAAIELGEMVVLLRASIRHRTVLL
jgi:glycosyltransferase involved in cell wall biosynthesis